MDLLQVATSSAYVRGRDRPPKEPLDGTEATWHGFTMADWSRVGPHRYVLTDDMLFWRPDGGLLAEHAKIVCNLLGGIIQHHGYALWLVDAEHSLPLGHEARQIYASWLVQGHGRVAMASFRAKRLAQTTAVLVTRGIEMLAPRSLVYQACETETEARSYLAQQRSSWIATTDS